MGRGPLEHALRQQDEEEPEEAGEFKKASEEAMKV